MKKILVVLLVSLLLLASLIPSACVGGKIMPDNQFSYRPFETGYPFPPFEPKTWTPSVKGATPSGFTGGTAPKETKGLPSAPAWGTPWGSMWGYPQWGGVKTDVGTKGKGASGAGYEGWTPAPPEEGQKSYEPFLEYLRGMGIRPLRGGGVTGTTRAFRSRLIPGAEEALYQWMEALGMPRESYLSWMDIMAPKSPYIPQRRWTPSMNYVRRW